MGSADLEAGLRAIAQNPALAVFVGPRDSHVVDEAEQALGVRFSPTYRRFVLKLGAGSFGMHEFYGITRGGVADAGTPNAIWLTLVQRQQADLPPSLILVYAIGDGSYYALDTGKTGEHPVVEWLPGSVSTTDCEIVAPDFGALFRELIEDELND